MAWCIVKAINWLSALNAFNLVCGLSTSNLLFVASKDNQLCVLSVYYNIPGAITCLFTHEQLSNVYKWSKNTDTYCNLTQRRYWFISNLLKKTHRRTLTLRYVTWRELNVLDIRCVLLRLSESRRQHLRSNSSYSTRGRGGHCRRHRSPQVLQNSRAPHGRRRPCRHSWSRDLSAGQS